MGFILTADRSPSKINVTPCAPRLNPFAIGQVDGNPGRPEGVAADFRLDPRGLCPPLNHLQSVPPLKRPVTQDLGLPFDARKRGLFGSLRSPAPSM
jgi:hypothetical protein